MYELPSIAALNITKGFIIESSDMGARGCGDPLMAKSTLYRAAAWALGDALSANMCTPYQSAVDFAEMMGDDPSDAIKEAFGQPAGSLAELVAQKLLAYLPAAGDEGKWLAKFGITEKDWYAPDISVIPESLRRAPLAGVGTPLPVPRAQVPTIEEDFLPPTTPADEEAEANANADMDEQARVNEEADEEIGKTVDLPRAWKALLAGATLDMSDYAKVLGVSRTSASNWLNGKPPRKITPSQIRAMRRDCQERLQHLTDALIAFGG